MSGCRKEVRFRHFRTDASILSAELLRKMAFFRKKVKKINFFSEKGLPKTHLCGIMYP